MNGSTQSLPDNWRLFDDAEQLAIALTDKILEIADQSIKEHGAFHFVTAGGTTPNRCYQLLSETDTDWSNWHIYMGDERVLPFVDQERNSQALLNHWISQVRLPPKHVHFINTEAGAEKSALAYAELIDSVEAFDFCLLGMGEDGHTASLFPDHKESDSVTGFSTENANWQPVIVEYDSPKAPKERVSLNYGAFDKCKNVYKLVSGASKQSALKAWLAGDDLPVKQVKGMENFVWVSKEAVPE